jgi:acetoin:2,6-dichlorophenolindophenol oxidoreductase subunit alpha
MTTELNKELLLRAYRMMRRIRVFEERVPVEFATGEIPGFVHLYAGEEASATGLFCTFGKKTMWQVPVGGMPLYR